MNLVSFALRRPVTVVVISMGLLASQHVVGLRHDRRGRGQSHRPGRADVHDELCRRDTDKRHARR